MITVLLPTTNRPAMLRTALRSIEGQSLIDSVDEIVVSENADGEDVSRSVCNQFPNLPIRYICQRPSLPALQHAEFLLEYTRSITNEIIAVLHDDDWWAVEHLANGMRALDQTGAVAYWSSVFFVDGESSWFNCWNLVPWMAANYPDITVPVTLTKEQAALACIPSTPAHYSSLLARRVAWNTAFETVLKTANPYDNDRHLFAELSKLGGIVMQFVPEVFCRMHAARDSKLIEAGPADHYVRRTTELIVSYCESLSIDVKSELEELLRRCPQTFRASLEAGFNSVAKEVLKDKGMLPATLTHQGEARTQGVRALAGRVIKLVTPPIITHIIRRVPRAAS